MRERALGLACVLFFGCASHHTTGEDQSSATLTIDPPTSELMLVDGTPASEGFTATLTFPDATTLDVTGEVQFTIDGSYGAFQASMLTMFTAGKTNVHASYTDKVASAEVIARLKGVRIDPNVPANAPDWFAGPEDPTHAPTVVYPPADVVMPRNLGDFEVHWRDASTNDVFEVSLTTDFADLRVYVLGGNGPYAALGPDPSWMEFLSSEWTEVVGNEPSMNFQVRGVQSSNPVSVGSAPPQLVQLTNEQMLGGIYYWSAAGTGVSEGIYRHDMGAPGVPAEEYITEDQTSGRCIACHVLSRDGTEMAITWDGGGAAGDLIDVGTKAFQGKSNHWNFGTFSPDGSQFLAVSAGSLAVRNYADQTVLATMTSAGWVTHPDLSPDGTQLVYVRPTVTSSDWSFGGGKIYIRSYDQASLSFGPEQLLFGDSANNYYPSFSPDGTWVLFNKSDDNSGNGAYSNLDATVWVMKADGSAPPIELANASVSAGLTDSWARWAPFAQTVGANNEPLYWVTTSSKRDFGVRLHASEIPPPPVVAGAPPGRPQIWMTPFFADKASAGTDPSTAAFRLPFQNVDSNNHIAQWTQQVVVTQ